MPTYVSLINYTDEGVKGVKDGPSRLDAAREAMKAAGGELKDFYLTMGAYDLVVISEFPSDEVAATFSLSLASQGRLRTTTLKAFPEAAYRKIIAAMP